MLRKNYPLFLFLVFISFLQIHAAGGPDAYGYVWRANIDPGGPTYNWVDIVSRPSRVQVVGLSDDNSVGMFNIGFSFHYYWNDYTQIRVGSNGWIAFDNVSNIAHCFPTIPNAGGVADNYLAPFMADLNFDGVGNPAAVYYWTNNVDSFVISYINTPFWVNATPAYTGNNNFQVILAKGDSSITFQYQTMDPTFTNNVGCASDNVVGIENSTGAIGLQVSAEIMPASNRAVKFYYPDSVLINVPDLRANWNQNVKSLGIFYPTGIVPLSGNIKNTGNVNITTSSAVSAVIQNSAFATVHTSTATLPSLTQGDDSTFVFNPATLTVPGYYFYNLSVSNSGDLNSSNNTLVSEIRAINLTLPTNTLTFASGAAGSGTLSWSGGALDDGGGVYHIPPTYPVTINSVEYYLTGGTDGYIAAIYDDNGPGGTPGTLLWSDTVPNTSVVPSAWNVRNVNPGVTITSGGYYIAWYQGGAGVFLGTETAAPLSRRNYEILAGAWADWRENQSQELLIRANISGYTCSPNAQYSFATSANVANFSNTTSGATSYAWNFGDGFTSTAANPTHAYSAAGTYNVCLVATNSCGSDTTCNLVTVTCPVPTPGFTFSQSGITFNFANSSAGATTYFWDFGDGGTSTLANPTHTYSSPGPYTVCLISSNICGSDTVCQGVVACFLPFANFNSTTSGTTVTFNNLSSTTGTTTWDFGDGNTSSATSPTHTYAGPGTYTVCLILQNNCAADTTCQTVTVSCVAPVSNFSFVASGLTVTFTNNSTSSTFGSISLSTWNFGDGTNSSTTNPTHTYPASGTYNVCLVVHDSCTTDTFCTTITLCAPPVAGFTFTSVNSQVAFSNNSSISGTATYAWDFGDGNTSTIPNPVNVYAASGNYTVCLTVTDACGMDTFCTNVNVIIADIEMPLENRVSVWPNPTRDWLNIAVEGAEGSFQVRLWDPIGRVVRTQKLDVSNGYQFQWNMRDLSNGIYGLEIQGPKDRMVHRIVVE